MENELISVIVPVFNTEKYLESCLASLLAQSDPQFEIILVNDGSQDQSAALCDDAQKRYSRVRAFHTENQGASYARNYGIEQAAGQYIVFLDADDRMEEDALKRMRRAMEENDADLVVGNYARFHDGEERDYCVNSASPEPLVVVNGPQEIARLFFKPATSLHGVAVWGKMYRKALIDAWHIRFPEEISYEEDCCFNVQYYRHIRRAVLLGDVVCHYRQTANSLSNAYKREGFHFLLHGYRERCAFIREIGLTDAQPQLDVILAIVIRNNCIKIASSGLTGREKISEYRDMLTEREVADVSGRVSFPRASLNGQLLRACQANDPIRMHLLMTLHGHVRRVKRALGR